MWRGAVRRLFRLALALLVARVGANNHNDAVATNDAAVVADWLHARMDLHVGCVLTFLIDQFLVVQTSRQTANSSSDTDQRRTLPQGSP